MESRQDLSEGRQEAWESPGKVNPYVELGIQTEIQIQEQTRVRPVDKTWAQKKNFNFNLA